MLWLGDSRGACAECLSAIQGFTGFPHIVASTPRLEVLTARIVELQKRLADKRSRQWEDGKDHINERLATQVVALDRAVQAAQRAAAYLTAVSDGGRNIAGLTELDWILQLVAAVEILVADE